MNNLGTYMKRFFRKLKIKNVHRKNVMVIMRERSPPSQHIGLKGNHQVKSFLKGGLELIQFFVKM